MTNRRPKSIQKLIPLKKFYVPLFISLICSQMVWLDNWLFNFSLRSVIFFLIFLLGGGLSFIWTIDNIVLYCTRAEKKEFKSMNYIKLERSAVVIKTKKNIFLLKLFVYFSCHAILKTKNKLTDSQFFMALYIVLLIVFNK